MNRKSGQIFGGYFGFLSVKTFGHFVSKLARKVSRVTVIVIVVFVVVPVAVVVDVAVVDGVAKLD